MSRVEIVRSPDDLRGALAHARRKNLEVGYVPTMGALHDGHLRLCQEARAHASLVVVSIFVNPTQFGKGEDLARYPRDLQGDVDKCAAAGVDLVFAPDADVMYPPGDATRVHVGGLTAALCGPFRPGHFEGVATVVAKFFALMAPCIAVFGRKDYQQLKVVERMTRDLLFPVRVLGMPTVRESDGLARSSRNAYLSPTDRAHASAIPRGLSAALQAFHAGERRAGTLRAWVMNAVSPVVSSVDYVSVADPDSLAVFADDDWVSDRALVALAVRVGQTRLIDNLVLGEDDHPLERPA